MAEKRYQPKMYDGRIVIFRASEKALRGLDDPQGGWQKFAAEVEIHEVDGDHGNILNDPQVRGLAAQICARLEKAQAELEEQYTPAHSLSSR